MKKMASLVAVIGAVAAIALSAPATAAEFPEGARQPFQFELGGAWDSFNTVARMDYTRNGIATAGTSIDFEKLLNIPVMEQHFRGTGQWKFSKVSSIQVGYESIRREGQRSLTEQIVWGDTTFGLGGLIDGKFDSTEAYLGYRYDAFQADNVRLALTIGFSYWDIEASLVGQGTVTKPDGSTSSGSFEKGFSIKAPVPVIGIAAEGAISKDFTFSFYARGLYVRLTDISGGEIQGGLAVKWYATKNFGVGLGVDVTSIQVKKYVKDDQTFSANYNFAGPRLSAVVGF
jgi:hypothetical protein